MDFQTILQIIKDFRKEISTNWCKETSYKPMKHLAGANRSVGQCVVTSLLLRERLAEKDPNLKTKIALGEVYDSKNNILIDDHGWIEAEDSQSQKWIIDITLDQSTVKIPVYFDFLNTPKDKRIVYKRSSYLGKKGFSGDLKKRYLLLKSRLNNCEEHCCSDKALPLNKYLQIGKGPGRYLLAIGESPAGNGWLKSGRAFFTPAGKVVPTGKNFLIMLRQIDSGLNLENISFTELAKCYIGVSRRKLHACATKTWPHFIKQLEYVKPKVIIILGQKTTEIFNFLAGTSLMVGEMQEVAINGQKYHILPLYHPSPLNPRRVHNAEYITKNRKLIHSLLKY